MRIAIISDTHSLLRPEVEEILRSCDMILHGGDIASQEIYEKIGNVVLVCVIILQAMFF